MKTPYFRRNRVTAAVAGALLALGATQALATGFQLNEQSASSIGNAFAAGAAFTDDVSAMWWNPAAMSSFSTRQFAAAVHLVTPMIEFNNSASLPALNQPLGNNGGDAGGLNFVPNMYFSMPLNPQWSIGVAINGPFGSKTEYDDGWIGRYQALLSEILTVNVNPAISWRPVPNFAVGVGVNYQYLDGTFTQNYNYSAAMAGAAASAAAAGQIPAALVPQVVAATPGLDGKATIKGDDSAWGWNIGAAWDVSPQWRLAASYRSELKYNLRGSSDYNNPAVPLPPNAQLAAVIATLSNAVNNSSLFRGQSVRSDITLPAIANISTVFRLNQQWELMADAQYTGWSSIPELKFVTADTGATVSAVPLAWDDSWKFALGASYRYNQQWKARMGIAYDQTPTNVADATPRLPDSDRWWFAFGGEYKWTPAWKLDAGFVWIQGKDPEFNQNLGNTALYGLINGNYSSTAWILSMQATYAF